MKLGIFLVLVIKLCAGQNLIYNGGFEIYNICPDDISQLEKATGWKGNGSTDFYNKCSHNERVSIPNSFVGKNSNSHSGNGYAGFGCSPYVYNYEFLQTKLIEPLNIKRTYCLSFYIKNTSNHKFTFDQLSFLFSKGRVEIKTAEFYEEKTLSESNFVIHNLTKDKKVDWVKVNVIHKPKTEEQFLIIGFNKTKDILNLKKQTKNQQVFYYAIDDISLVEIKDSSECVCNDINPRKKDSIKVEIVQSYYDSADVKASVLKNIVFESNKSNLLPISNSELNNLVTYLKSHPTKTIELYGYTDNKGKETDNIKLSELRVKSVADYLTSKGIETKRITFKGYGSKNPLRPNDTEGNKAKNRRVEFRINKTVN